MMFNPHCVMTWLINLSLSFRSGLLCDESSNSMMYLVFSVSLSQITKSTCLLLILLNAFLCSLV